MKISKLIVAAIITLIVTTTSYGIYTYNKHNSMSDLMLANIEALADDEVSITGCQPNGGTCVISIGGTHIIKDDQHP